MHVHRVCLSLHLIKKTVKRRRTFHFYKILVQAEGEKKKQREEEEKPEQKISVANRIIAVAYAM